MEKRLQALEKTKISSFCRSLSIRSVRQTVIRALKRASQSIRRLKLVSTIVPQGLMYVRSTNNTGPLLIPQDIWRVNNWNLRSGKKPLAFETETETDP